MAIHTNTTIELHIFHQFLIRVGRYFPAQRIQFCYLTWTTSSRSLDPRRLARPPQIIRAARLYQQAVWVAESDPNQAWILLVSAVEVAATSHVVNSQTSTEIINDLWPEMASVLKSIPDEHSAEVARLVSPLVKSTSKFLTFLMAHLPHPPPIRPSETLRVDWADMRKSLSKVYNYRSQALHSGSPFPAPLLKAPLNPDQGPPPEIPFGLAAGDGSSVWLAKDMPMHLHLFEYVVRGALIRWWQEAMANEPLADS